MKYSKKEDIKTFEDACIYLELDSNKVIPGFSNFPEKHQKTMEAHSKLIIVNEAINTVENNGEPWFPNWEDACEYKYYPWFNMGSSSGVGFSFYVFDYWDSYSSCGSRLCFISSDAAKYAGEQFKDMYKTYFLI